MSPHNPELTAAVERAADAVAGWLLPEDEYELFLVDRTDREGARQKLLSELSPVVERLEAERNELRTLCGSLAGALSEVKNAVQSEPAMNRRGYDGIGIRVNEALSAYSKFKEGK